MSRFALHAVLVDFIHEVSHISADSSFLRSAKARFLRSYACRHAVPQNLAVGPRLGLSHTGQIRPYRLSKPRFLRLISEAFNFSTSLVCPRTTIVGPSASRDVVLAPDMLQGRLIGNRRLLAVQVARVFVLELFARFVNVDWLQCIRQSDEGRMT